MKDPINVAFQMDKIDTSESLLVDRHPLSFIHKWIWKEVNILSKWEKSYLWKIIYRRKMEYIISIFSSQIRICNNYIAPSVYYNYE